MRVANSKDHYLNEVFNLADEDLARVRVELEKARVGFMSISDHEARCIQFLIRGFGIQKIVEFGTLFGYSALAMAKALPEAGRIWTIEKDESTCAVARRQFQASPVGGKIESLCGAGIDIARQLSVKGPFDMVFIDADKVNYLNYLEWAEANVRSGGLIVGDNTFLFGALWGESRDKDVNEKKIKLMLEFNERLSDPKRYNSMLVPTTEGLTVAQKL